MMDGMMTVMQSEPSRDDIDQAIAQLVAYRKFSYGKIGMLLGLFLGVAEMVMFLLFAGNSQYDVPQPLLTMMLVIIMSNLFSAPILLGVTVLDYTGSGDIKEHELSEMLDILCEARDENNN